MAKLHGRRHGMSPDEAMARHGLVKDGYRGAEGKVVNRPYKVLLTILFEILGGVRSACTYIGAKRLKDIGKCTILVRCTTGKQLMLQIQCKLKTIKTLSPFIIEDFIPDVELLLLDILAEIKDLKEHRRRHCETGDPRANTLMTGVR